ncbi:hypothetical protein L7F22_065590 [Adiantum nelumboides]|nr:hypothetical protein [Adiantum nelumboides]
MCMQDPQLPTMAQACLVMAAMLLCLAPCHHALIPSLPSPSPAPAPTTPTSCNITQVIDSAGQFSSFLQLMSQTGVGDKFQAQANQTHIGITIFAPIDKAFTRAPASALLKNITQQQKVSLCEYHALPKWYPLASLQHTNDNVTSTYATYNGGGGRYSFNVTDENGNVEIKTEWVSASIVSTLYNAAPCSIFAIDEVLLPEDIFGLPAPAPAPAPSAGAPVVSPSAQPVPSMAGSSTNPASSTAQSGPSSQPSIAPPLPCFQALLATSIFLCFKISFF